MRGWPVFMISQPAAIAIAVVLLIIAAVVIGVLISG